MKSTNYSNFKMVDNNRNINNGLVERLTHSIEKLGYIEARPILVNDNMEIIDGQHRFLACKKLGLPIVYAQYNGEATDEDIIVELNTTQLIWRLADYINHYAVKGVKFHKVLSEFESAYKLGTSSNIIICAASEGTGTAGIRTGKNAALNPKREEIAAFLLSLNSLSFYKNTKFVRAIVVLFKKGTHEHIKRLYKHHLLIQQQASVTAYLAVFANLINKRLDESNKISFIND